MHGKELAWLGSDVAESGGNNIREEDTVPSAGDCLTKYHYVLVLCNWLNQP